MTFKSCFIIIGLLLLLQSCGDGHITSGENGTRKGLDGLNGIYVSEGYQTRDDDSDWMVVSVISLSKNQAQISIRSRVDNGKTATCAYSSTATMTENKNMLKATFPENSIDFSFTENQLNISGSTEADISFLESFCQEGSSIAGSYVKLSEPLDDAQLLKGGFVRKLSMHGITFKIQAGSSGSSNELLIQPAGLSESNEKIVRPIKGFIKDAKVADLDGDSWPELLLFIDLGKSKKTGTVLAYSAEDGKSLSEITYPNTFGADQISEGYFGQDTFYLSGQQLIQAFPVHSVDGKITNKVRRVEYSLVEKEGALIFDIGEVVEN